MTGIGIEPSFAIGQRALRVDRLLWDCIPLVDEGGLSAVRSAGGIDTIGESTVRNIPNLNERFNSLLPLIQASMVKSGVVEYKAPFVLKRDFTPNFPLRLMLKDIDLALAAAKEARVKLPALETVQEIYEMAAEDGHQDLDYAATLTLLEKWAGVEVKGAA